MELLNRVAVITGVSGCIGKAMAKAFLAEGAKAGVLADMDAAARSSSCGSWGRWPSL